MQIVEARGNELGGATRGVLPYQVCDAVDSILVVGVSGFRQAVGVEEQHIAGFHVQTRGGEIEFMEHSQRQAGGFDAQHPAVPYDNCGPVAGIMDFHLPAGLGLSAYQSGVLSSQCALAEDAICLGDHLAERQAHTSQAAEQGVELRHQHGGGHAFTGNVAEHEEELSIGLNQVTVIAANGANRRVMIASLPATGPQSLWQQIRCT